MNIDLRHTGIRLVTRRAHVIHPPISDRDLRVLERRARRAASCPTSDDRATLGRRVADRVVSIIATLPGVTGATGRKRPARPAANEDLPTLRAA